MDEQDEPISDVAASADLPPAPADTAEAVEPGPEAALEAPAEPSPSKRGRRRTVLRFAAAFAFGLLAVLAVAAGALAAFESSNQGRILPGVHVGSVDLSGLTPTEASSRLRDAYGTLGDGQLVLSAGGHDRSVSYSDLGRRIDVDAIVARAMAVGRGGPPIERIASNVRTIVRGLDLGSAVTFDQAALGVQVAALADDVDTAPVSAAVTTGDSGFTVTPGSSGVAADTDATIRAATTLLLDPAAPSTVRVDVPMQDVQPEVTTADAQAARDAAVRIAVDVLLVNGNETWTLPGSSIRGWISFARTDGTYSPVVARDGLAAGLATIAADVAIAPVDASFLISDKNAVVGVSAAKEGRALDVASTTLALEQLIQQRAQGQAAKYVAIRVTTVEPALTTEEATKTAPLMKPISEWTTYFPVGDRNGFGANIWIPAANLDGMVVKPGAWFDFWKAIGPVSRAAGYTDGGAIINGHTEPQGALAGGICSCSTTMFNAALRGGMEMGARENHYYYIDRYPLGLDATVFQSSSGSVQSMTWRNDTPNPVLIRSYRWKVGVKGYVKFVLWSVPTGRTVIIQNPIVKNILPASDSIVYRTDLPAGVKNRVEYPVDGKDVWRTVIVMDASGAIIHQTTYYSHYARVTGVLEIGTGGAPPPATP